MREKRTLADEDITFGTRRTSTEEFSSALEWHPLLVPPPVPTTTVGCQTRITPIQRPHRILCQLSCHQCLLLRPHLPPPPSEAAPLRGRRYLLSAEKVAAHPSLLSLGLFLSVSLHLSRCLASILSPAAWLLCGVVLKFASFHLSSQPCLPLLSPKPYDLR